MEFAEELGDAMASDVGPEGVNEPRGGGDSFAVRHIGPNAKDCDVMLKALGYSSLADFINKVIPVKLRQKEELFLTDFPSPLSETGALSRLRKAADANEVWRSYLGMGYSSCITPAVILRNILENPGWYTPYTPYQPEISQGRLEALLNYQTMIADLTGLPIANASLLDEGTAAAEAMNLAFSLGEGDGRTSFFIAADCHPQTIDVVCTRARALGIHAVVGPLEQFSPDKSFCGVLVQYPTTQGVVRDYSALAKSAHDSGIIVIAAADLLALTLLTPPGEWGADVAVGTSQRFGVPLGYGGPHAAFFSTRDDYKRSIPGRLIGVSRDARGRPALRLALQTREQHIRREKATSNICTAQVLLAVMAGMYGVYHGPKGLHRIATRINESARALASAVKGSSVELVNGDYFDTVAFRVTKGNIDQILARASAKKINIRVLDPRTVAITVDESTGIEDLRDLVEVVSGGAGELVESGTLAESIPPALRRRSGYLTHDVFNRYHSETEFLRYIRRLEAKDLSLGTAMIPLGSCTMKLNATTEMIPVTWPEFANIHPFAPREQARGYERMFGELERALEEITGFDAVSLQPNAGSQGEYAGLLAIRDYHRARGDLARTVCLIPKSAHGTNPASAVMAGMEVVVVACDTEGNIDLADLRAKAEETSSKLAALMVTYPSTHGVFEESIRDIAAIIHQHGGQVYMDGANLNALVGLCRPAEIGADVCHINLHKTFCIPHGGGGPGMGPIGVKAHLAPFLPGHAVVPVGREDLNFSSKPRGDGAVSAAPWGSAAILPISWSYIAMMAGEGLTRASEVAILSANYVAKKLDEHYPVLYKGENGLVAHECILDLRGLKKAGVEVEDVAKRLMDYNFHAPTVSWPVAGTLMVEPTESESLAELDRFCDAMISIRREIRAIEEGRADRENNLLKNAPHTAADVVTSEWNHPYSREEAAFPMSGVRENKFWPAVGRLDSTYGDRNLVCSCPSIESYGKS